MATVTSLVDRLLARGRWSVSPRGRRRLLAASAAGVVAAATWAWLHAGLSIADLHWPALVLSLLIAAPLSLALRAAEFDVAARLAGRPVGPRRSLGVALVASAANLLPLPGSLLVTWRALTDGGSPAGRAAGAGAAPGLTWLALTGVVGGTAMIGAGAPVPGLVAVAGGIVVGTAAARLVRRLVGGGRHRLLAGLVAVESGWLAVSALRLSLALAALGHAVELDRVVALSVAGALTTAVGIFPAGLGLREALIAVVGTAVGLGLDVSVLVGTVDRLVWLVFLGGALTVVAWRGRTPSP